MAAFEVGQRVKVIGGELRRGQVGVIIEVDDSADCLTYRVHVDDGLKWWFSHMQLELIPDEPPTPQPTIQYPPLRVLINGKPSQTWQQVLESKPLATSQPHLYFLGGYFFWSESDLNEYILESPTVVIIDSHASQDVTRDRRVIPIEYIYRVFVIAEGE